ncbi:hypothetical protein C8R42DRAFT_460409 [Lentinula raphanica]|nr:hypothetical protein C8R42DRAFT_460409 [Lentinula raphanica]
MSRNFARRKRQWDRECPCAGRIWRVPIAVMRRRRAGTYLVGDLLCYLPIIASEALAHLLLERECDDRPRIYCRHCCKTHREIFIFNASRKLTWRNIIRPLHLVAVTAFECSNSNNTIEHDRTGIIHET